MKELLNNLHWPQYVVLVWFFLNLCATAIKHGKPREGTINFFGVFLSIIALLFLLIAGGFFG